MWLACETTVSVGVQSCKEMTCTVCAWTMLADSDMSPVYTLPLVLCALLMCYLQVRYPLRDWRKLDKCQKSSNTVQVMGSMAQWQ